MSILTTINHVERVPYSMVTVTQGSQSWDLLSGADGMTTSVPLNVLDMFELSVHEVQGEAGEITVGQHLFYDNREFSPTALDSLLVSASVPVCRPIGWQFQDGHRILHDGIDPAWIGLMGASATLSADPLIGFLPEGVSVDAYLNYHQRSLVPGAMHGFILRLNKSVELPKSGLVLAVDVRDYYANPTVSALRIGNGIDTVEFKASIFDGAGWQPLPQDDDIYILVTGTLSEGDNVILIHESQNPDSDGVDPASGSPSDGTLPGMDESPLPLSVMTPYHLGLPAGFGMGPALPNPYLAPTLNQSNQGSCTPKCPPTCTTSCTPPTPPTLCGFTPINQGTEETTICQAIGLPVCQPNPKGEPVGNTTGAGFAGGINIWVIGNIGGTAYQEASSVAKACECTMNFFCNPGKKTSWRVKRAVRAFLDGGSIWRSDVRCVEMTIDTHCGSNAYMTSNTCPIPGCG